jgi:hypothetical protein
MQNLNTKCTRPMLFRYEKYDKIHCCSQGSPIVIGWFMDNEHQLSISYHSAVTTYDKSLTDSCIAVYAHLGINHCIQSEIYFGKPWLVYVNVSWPLLGWSFGPENPPPLLLFVALQQPSGNRVCRTGPPEHRLAELIPGLHKGLKIPPLFILLWFSLFLSLGSCLFLE